jgi:methyl-accepting chemotaxis protein
MRDADDGPCLDWTTAAIANEIDGVDRAAGQMAEGSEQVMVSATERSRVAEQLQTTVLRFKV